MIISITGVTGNMGQAVFNSLESLDFITKFKLLCNDKKEMKRLLKHHKKILNKCELIDGKMEDRKSLSSLVSDSDIVINLAAVIPPKADQHPSSAVSCNDLGVKLLVEEIERISTNQPTLIHISSVAVYGNRTKNHKFIKVGDPLLPSVYDVYSVAKMRGEWSVLESSINKWVILRQTGMLHPNIFADNIKCGLLFHTVLDAPIEWVTSYDSGVLIANIVKQYHEQKIKNDFWRRCYNISGGKRCRNYGIQTFDNGFSVLGGTTQDFFKPYDIITRNFHCGWYLDAEELEDLFHYQSQTVDEFWKAVFDKHPIFKLGKIVPKCLIRKFLFDKLKKDKLAPEYWYKHNDKSRIKAFYGGEEKYQTLRSLHWDEFPLPRIEDVTTLNNNYEPTFYGYDINKSDDQITEDDLINVALAHGGKLLSKYNNDMYEKLEWVTQDGETFRAAPHTILRAGHWYNSLYKDFIWDFDRLSKKDKIYADIWYDSHSTNEDMIYKMDDTFNPICERIESE